MAILEFPNIDSADEHGLLALGGDLEVPSLLLAYSRGIFPWPIDENYPLAWFSPDPRGVIFLEKFKIPKTFKKVLNNNSYTVRFNKDFHSVIKHCALSKNRKDQGTWITKQIIDAYMALHFAGYAFSVEVYKENQLVGGLYGVNYKNCISGESMFYLEDNASKLALYALLNRLKSRGVAFLDTQMMTPVVKSFGGEEIPRNEFLELIREAQSRPSMKFFPRSINIPSD